MVTDISFLTDRCRVCSRRVGRSVDPAFPRITSDVPSPTRKAASSAPPPSAILAVGSVRPATLAQCGCGAADDVFTVARFTAASYRDRLPVPLMTCDFSDPDDRILVSLVLFCGIDADNSGRMQDAMQVSTLCL